MPPTPATTVRDIEIASVHGERHPELREVEATFATVADELAAHMFKEERIDGCTTYRVCLEELKAFEQDLHTHVHLENNILFPKARALERAGQTPAQQ